MQRYISRPLYERQLEELRGTTDIKVLTGVRRCGKSSLLQMLAERVCAEVGEHNVLYLRMDQFGIPLNPTAEWLERKVMHAIEEADDARPLSIFLDEVQEVESWEKVVRRLHTQRGVDVWLTGSNAHVLSSDLATLLGGRYRTVSISPLSFDEYLTFWRECDLPTWEKTELFAEYLRYGGMPAQFDLPARGEERLSAFLTTIYETIILNDVAEHANISDLDLLSKLVRYVFSTSGTMFSTRAIVNALASSGRKSAVETVDNYLRALQDAFIMQSCEQVGLAGKQVLRPQRKYYPVDTGMRNLMTNFSPSDLGAQLECVVYNELRRRGYHVEVGALRCGEIDFVAQRTSERMYIQVSAYMESDETFEREVRPFESLADSYPCFVFTLDAYRTGVTEKGVRVVNLIEWLLSER